mmetsp:Transcript_10375/g.31912  ORF Transcript_10375/g.31912 Transcript_10375/m.31912 type:complete len:237 (+) Transcript_10375:1033-1743(+)
MRHSSARGESPDGEGEGPGSGSVERLRESSGSRVACAVRILCSCVYSDGHLNSHFNARRRVRRVQIASCYSRRELRPANPRKRALVVFKTHPLGPCMSTMRPTPRSTLEMRKMSRRLCSLQPSTLPGSQAATLPPTPLVAPTSLLIASRNRPTHPSAHVPVRETPSLARMATAIPSQGPPAPVPVAAPRTARQRCERRQQLRTEAQLRAAARREHQKGLRAAHSSPWNRHRLWQRM